MGFAKALFVCLRTLQGILSLAVLGCGIYVAYTLRSLAQQTVRVTSWVQSYVNNTTATLDEKEDINDGVKVVKDVFAGPPIRAYVLCGVSLWSLCVILCLLLAQYTRNHTSLNRRSIVIPLEVFTLIFWIAGFVSVATLAIEYEPVCYVFEWVDKFGKIKELLDNLPVLGNMLQNCLIEKLAATAAAFCWSLFCITSIAACCMDRDGTCCGRRSKQNNTQPEMGVAEDLIPTYLENGTAKPGFVASGTPVEIQPPCFTPIERTAYDIPSVDHSRRKLPPYSPSSITQWSTATPGSRYYQTGVENYSPALQYSFSTPNRGDFSNRPLGRVTTH